MAELPAIINNLDQKLNIKIFLIQIETGNGACSHRKMYRSVTKLKHKPIQNETKHQDFSRTLKP